MVHGAGTGVAVGGDDTVHTVQPGFENGLELRVVLDLAGVLGVLQVGEAGLGVLFQDLLLYLPQDIGGVALEVGKHTDGAAIQRVEPGVQRADLRGAYLRPGA